MVLTPERRLVLETVRKVAREVLWPLAPEYDREAKYPWPQLKALAELGLLGMTTPEEWGGAGLDSVTWALALEEIAAADPSVAVIVSVSSGLPQYMLLRFGTEEQKRRFLPPLARGEWIGAFCLTEPHAGSDPASLRAEARRVPGGYELWGVKSWITSAGQAHLYVVMARTEKDIGLTEEEFQSLWPHAVIHSLRIRSSSSRVSWPRSARALMCWVRRESSSSP